MSKKNFKLVLALVLSLLIVASSVAFAEVTPSAEFTYTGTDATTNGKIAITNATENVTYSLYKIFDATYSATDATKVSYTIKAGDLKNEISSNGADYFVLGTTADANGNYSVTRKMQASPNDDKPVKSDSELIAYLTGLNTSLFTKIGDIKSSVNGKIEWKSIPYGYYIIKPDSPTPTAAVTIDTNNPTVDVIDKNQTYTMTKFIKEGDQELTLNEASLKEDISFEITTHAVNFHGEKKVFKYQINDTLENGMTYKAAPTVKVNGTPVTTGVEITYKDKAGTATTDITKAQSFTLEINWTADGTKNTAHLYDSNATILVEYKAFLDPTKAADIDIGGSSINGTNKNTATVKSYEGNDNPTEKNPSGTVGTDYTDTFTTELTILKNDDDAKALQGAEFTLTTSDGAKVVITTKEIFVEDNGGDYWKLNDGTFTTDDPNQTGMDTTKYASTTQKYSKTTTTVVTGEGQTQTAIKAEVGTDGKVTFTGLGVGTYKITETKVPAGYNKVADIDFTIGFQYTGDGKTHNVSDIVFTSNNPDVVVGSDNKLDTTIVNHKGVELPSTGGIGTTIFYVAGSILVLAAAILLITKRRMGADE